MKILKKTFLKLKGRMVEKFGSIKGFADASGIPANTINSKLTGRRKINQEDMRKWGEVLEIPVSEYYDYFF